MQATSRTAPRPIRLPSAGGAARTAARILVYRYWNELGTAEIAALMELSSGAVWVNLHRARQTFKRHFTTLTEGSRAHR
ncbi:hypothetical protein Asi03nite_25970 [Actinoplanes siamensis]|uniref:RNA polymerase sigma factor 70 region 4 type 2 domain-containing protein n=1 Tax=Actinoplanes siamensis TaxID=1223317 RepID=A0A919N5Z6_9ACTN|nr:hypothetical protein Asi03nite_25970 [Actinoplanes siamensis]